MLVASKYIDVILPLPLKGTFTYSVDNEDLLIGQRVVVQFGVRKLYTAIIKSIHSKKPVGYDVKPVLGILDELPIVNLIQLKFWDWIVDYYMCNLGDVMNAALPSSLKLASESKLIIHEDFDGDIDGFLANEHNLLNVLLQQEEMSIHELSKIIKIKNIFSLINQLIRKEIIQIKEDLHEKYKQKEERIVKFISSKKKLEDIRLTSKQQGFITAFLKLENQLKNERWVISELLKKVGFSRSIFNALVAKGIFSVKKESISRLLKSSHGLIKNNELVDFQKKALGEIKTSFKQRDVCLLHGVTSSGKTELYIRLIQEQLEKRVKKNSND